MGNSTYKTCRIKCNLCLKISGYILTNCHRFSVQLGKIRIRIQKLCGKISEIPGFFRNFVTSKTKFQDKTFIWLFSRIFQDFPGRFSIPGFFRIFQDFPGSSYPAFSNLTQTLVEYYTQQLIIFMFTVKMKRRQTPSIF